MGRALVVLALLIAACKSEDEEHPLPDPGGGAAAPAPAALPPGVSRHFDFNGDGFDDAIVGQPGAGPGGQVFIFLGNRFTLGGVSAAVADVTITGEAAGDNFGFSVADAGDVNGDGFDDLIVGAPLNDTGGVDAGRAYVFFGSAAPGGAFGAAAANAILTGAVADGRFGSSVSSAGNVNADAFDDVIVGARLASTAQLFLGGAALAASTLFTGEAAGDQFGVSVSSAGDFNVDGFGDVIVGANLVSRAYLFLGAAAPPAARAAALADVIFTGEAGFIDFGFSVSDARSVNGDAFADVIVGAPSIAGANGRAYVFFGSAAPVTPRPAAGADVILDGEDPADRFGFSVATAGDVNADGVADLIVGAPFDAVTIGRAYVIFGSISLAGLQTMPGDADVLMTGEAAGDEFGTGVSTIGDFNGDGFDDTIVGAIFSLAAPGRVYVDLGSPAAVFAAATADITFTGNIAGDAFGRSVD